jgi:AmmeMemoRadiSam system protein B
VAAFTERLDQAGLLDSERFAALEQARRRAFLAEPERPAIHAGGAYPAEPAVLERFLEEMNPTDEPPAVGRAGGRGQQVRGLIAPHIDLHRGGATYARTYRALAEREAADLYLLLGTCHTPMGTPLAATRKRYATPFGPAPVDHRFLDLLEALYPGDLYLDELSHRAEHSLEFQAVYLRHLGLVGGPGAAGVVTLLCGSLHEWVPAGRQPGEVRPIAESVEALRTALQRHGGRVCLIAAADLAHVGPQFGDRRAVDSVFLQAVERADRAMLDRVCRGDAAGFFAGVMADGDARRICGLAPIYYLLALLGPSQGEVLQYSQWVDEQGQGSVTYAGVIFDA